MPIQLSVIGGAVVDEATEAQAFDVGRLAAERGWLVITGGGGGVMAAASRGAVSARGVTVAILPTYDKTTANPYAGVVIPTGLGYARNAVVVAAGDAVIAVGGSYGTLAEIALAVKLGKPVVGINSWPGVGSVRQVADAAAAVAEIAASLE
jgi:hypothetical protein